MAQPSEGAAAKYQDVQLAGLWIDCIKRRLIGRRGLAR
jgi:hypothetical protein